MMSLTFLLAVVVSAQPEQATQVAPAAPDINIVDRVGYLIIAVQAYYDDNSLSQQTDFLRMLYLIHSDLQSCFGDNSPSLTQVCNNKVDVGGGVVDDFKMFHRSVSKEIIHESRMENLQYLVQQKTLEHENEAKVAIAKRIKRERTTMERVKEIFGIKEEVTPPQIQQEYEKGVAEGTIKEHRYETVRCFLRYLRENESCFPLLGEKHADATIWWLIYGILAGLGVLFAREEMIGDAIGHDSLKYTSRLYVTSDFDVLSTGSI